MIIACTLEIKMILANELNVFFMHCIPTLGRDLPHNAILGGGGGDLVLQ